MLKKNKLKQKFKLITSKQEADFIYKNVEDGMIYLDKYGKILKISPWFLDFMGLSKKEVIGKRFHSFKKFFSAESFEKALMAFINAVEEKARFGEFIVFDKTGKKRVLKISGSPIRRKGEFVGILALARDITKERMNENSLVDLEERYRAIFDSAFCAVLVYDFEGNILEANKSAENLFGFKKEDFLSQKIKDFLGKKELNKIERESEIIKKDKKTTLEIEMRKKNGKLIQAEVFSNCFLISGKKLTQIFIKDITEQRKKEREIIMERKKVESYLNLVEVMIVALDMDGKVTLINKKGAEIIGDKEENIIGKNWFSNFIPKKRRLGIREVFEKIIIGEEKLVERYDNPILTKNGQEKMISWHNTVLKGQEGEIIGTLSSGEDVTEKEVFEKEIQRTNRELEAKVRDLNRMNKFMVDRELKMIELKKRIGKLEEQLDPSKD